MDRLHITRRCNGNWIINLYVLLCNLNIIISQSCHPNNDTLSHTFLPQNWPCEWNSGKIPYIYNFYSIGLKRLIGLVNKGHSYIEKRSCLKFVEHNPMIMAKKNISFLFYNYSGVLENCCLKFFSKPFGRRLIVISPICTLPAEVAHATLHGLGLTHRKHEPLNEAMAKAVFFPTTCHNMLNKKKLFDSKL